MAFEIFPAALLSVYLIIVWTFVFLSAQRNLCVIVHAMHTQSHSHDSAQRFQSDCIHGLGTSDILWLVEICWKTISMLKFLLHWLPRSFRLICFYPEPCLPQVLIHFSSFLNLAKLQRKKYFEGRLKSS